MARFFGEEEEDDLKSEERKRTNSILHMLSRIGALNRDAEAVRRKTVKQLEDETMAAIATAEQAYQARGGRQNLNGPGLTGA
jgi:hypothetical protein